jgi:hypothetical protein
MDGFIAVSWKKTPGCGLARLQVAQQIIEQSCWNYQLVSLL